MEIRYIRDTDGRELDFVVLKNGEPQFAVECKSGEKSLSRHIPYFKQRTSIPGFYQVHLGTREWGKAATGCVIPFTRFFNQLSEGLF
jgi:hypothetical protein